MEAAQTLARPYAKAIFQLAKTEGTCQEWADLLQLIAVILAVQPMVNLVKNPMISATEKADFIISIGVNKFNQQAKALIHLLAEYNRLDIGTDIYDLYEQYREKEEQVIRVEICSAIALAQQQQQKICIAMSKYFNKEVACSWAQDPELIGGFIAKTGSEVFDGSIRGQLQSLRNELVSH